MPSNGACAVRGRGHYGTGDPDRRHQWTAWSPVDRAQVESGHLLGEVRRFRVLGGQPVVAAADQPGADDHLRAATPLGLRGAFRGAGVRNYAVEVNLIPTPAGGTDIRWRVSLRPSVTGTGGTLRWMLQRLYADTATGLARAAEADPRRFEHDR